MAAVPVPSHASSAKLYRFAPTRELRADYDAVVPVASRARKCTRDLREYLKRREEDIAIDELLFVANPTPCLPSGIENEYPIRLPSVQPPSDAGCGEEDSAEPWQSRLQRPLLSKIAVLRRALYLAGKDSKEAENGVNLLVTSARESPSATASILSRHVPQACRLEETAASGVVRCADGGCDRRAIPYSRFCLNHISSDPDQVLYGFCTASDDNGKPCGNTVFDFLLNRPLCSKHVTKASLENPMQQQKRKTVVTNRATKVKGKVQKSKKTVATKVVVSKPTPVTTTATVPTSLPATLPATLPALSSTSSWTSGESDGENPTISEPKRIKVAKPPPPPSSKAAADPEQLPSLTPEAALDMSLTTIPLPSLILPPPLPDIGKFMDDSSSEDSSH